jgi:hypothetical protein
VAAGAPDAYAGGGLPEDEPGRSLKREKPKGETVIAALFVALVAAIGWSEATAYIARTIGYRTPAGMWAGAFGFPGVILANWLAQLVGPAFSAGAKRVVMFLVNWIFYFSVIEGALSLKRLLSKTTAETRET